MISYLALTLLLLELEADTTDGAALDTLHQVGGETGDLVAEALRGDNGDLIDDLLVGVEVDRVKARVVLLNEHTRSALGSLSANATLHQAKSCIDVSHAVQARSDATPLQADHHIDYGQKPRGPKP